MRKTLPKTLFAVIALLLAAPMLSACGDPINYNDRPLADRMCVPAYPTLSAC